MNYFIEASLTTPKMKIALRSSDRFCGTAEQAWKILPNGLRELILDGGGGESANKLHDLHEVFTTFVPRCCDLFASEPVYEYDWDIPRSIDAAIVVAGDLYLEGKLYLSVKVILFTAILREFVSDVGILSLKSMSKLVESEKRCQVLSLNIHSNVAAKYFAHIYHAAVNTRTTKLLRDYLSNVYPSESIWRRKLMGSIIPFTENYELFYRSNLSLDREVRRRKLVTLFCAFGRDNYREVQICEDSTLFELFKVYYLHHLHNRKEFECDTDVSPASVRRGLLAQSKGTGRRIGNFVNVNYETKFHLLTSAQRSLKELGIKEGDTITCRLDQFNDCAAGVGAGETDSHKSYVYEQAPRNTKRRSDGKKKRKSKTSSHARTANQMPTNEQIKEAHSRKMESVLNEMRPQLQPIRRKLDSLTLQRQLPKQKKGVKVISHGDKENIGNFANVLGAKAGKTVYPILAGLESNLYSSSKVSRNRKAISLDLHGLSKKQALKTLQENLPRWVDTAMKGEHPWVIPVNVICGGGSQELSEVVSAWIRREPQVANRPKSFM